MSTKRIYRKRRLRLYLDVDADLLPADFADEDSAHPRVYFRAPTWGDLEESAEDHGDVAQGIWLLAACITGTGGDFSLCLHEGTRSLGDVSGDIDERVKALRTVAVPDISRMAGYVGDLASMSGKEAGESVAAAA